MTPEQLEILSISIEPKVLTAKEIDSLRIKSYKFNFQE